jgi:hypothetical protein
MRVGRVLVVLLGATVPAHAAPILVTGGVFGFDSGDPPSFRFEISESPHVLSGMITDAAGLASPPDSAFQCVVADPCFSGDILSRDLTVGGTGEGFAGVDPNGPRPMEATFQFTTPKAALVGQATSEFPFSGPFTFSGRFRLFADESRTQVLYEAFLRGSGRGSVIMTQASGPLNTTGPYVWEETSYAFFPTPVPEPATLALLGSGLIAAWAVTRPRRPRDERGS